MLTPPPARSGFNVETVNYNNIKFHVWDLGGQTSIRPYWRCYYKNTDAVIYVVDSADQERLDVAKEELHAMLEEDELKDAILVSQVGAEGREKTHTTLHAQSLCLPVGFCK